MRIREFMLPDVTKLHFDYAKSKFRKYLYLQSILVLIIFISSTFFVHTVFAAVSEGCGIFEIRPDCDLSGWLHLTIGDVVIGAFLAILLHFLTHRNSLKIEKNALKIQEMIDAQEQMRTRRRDYAIQSVKNHFTSLLLTMSVINRFISSYDKEAAQKNNIHIKLKGEEEGMERIIQATRNAVFFASDVLDPVIVNQIDELCSYIGQKSITEENGRISFPGYEEAKSRIMNLSKRL